MCRRLTPTLKSACLDADDPCGYRSIIEQCCSFLEQSDMEPRVATKNVFVKDTQSMRDLRVLEEIARDPSMSQREVADHLGVAVGIVNACIHALVRKGLVKVRGENNRSITYHLTKKGVLHKSKLAFEWTMNTIDFYRDARGKVAARLTAMADAGTRRVALYGAGELAEIALIVSGEAGVLVSGVSAMTGVDGPRALASLPVTSLAEALATLPQAVVTCAVPAGEDERLLAESGLPAYDLTGNLPWPFPKGGES
jgi:ribosomal protein S25